MTRTDSAMRRLRAAAVAAMTLAAGTAGAGEGMWLPEQLPRITDQLQTGGLKIDPSRLAELTAHPMNAVISLGNCTASFVSDEGLAVTNHHCAYSTIQHNSDAETNLLADGFLARSRDEELPARPGTRILVTDRVDDVTDEVLGDLEADLDGLARYQRIEAKQKALVARCEKADGYRCNLHAFYGGSRYLLIRQLEIRDVRLVYAPAESIGAFGGHVDNWIWPRHTGDFSFYRAYVGPDGKPADPDPGNVPFSPPGVLRVSPEGLSDGSFVMAAGYPGSTNRYRLAVEAEERVEWEYPVRKAVFDRWIDLIETATAGDEQAEVRYASLVTSLKNVSKNYQGMLDGFASSDIVERKRAMEADLQKWIAASPDDRAGYADALAALSGLVDEYSATRERRMFYEYLARRGELIRAATQLYRWSRERTKADIDREPGYQDRDEERFRERLTRLDRGYTPAIDRLLWADFIRQYAELPGDRRNAEFDAWFGIGADGIDAKALADRLETMYARTTLTDQARRLAFIDATPGQIETSGDPFLELAVALYDSDLALEQENKTFTGRFRELRPAYMNALLAWRESQGETLYDDANGTLRVTFGNVTGYSPRDAVRYAPFTTLRGIVEKHTGVEPFDAPEALLVAIESQADSVFYDSALRSVPVNFVATLDSTGGNSGSPVLNDRAELAGLLFDGNYEAINSDWDYNPALTRTICVDARFMLWVMQSTDGAHDLLRELGIDPQATREDHDE